MEAFLGLAILVLTFLMLRRLAPRRGLAPHAVMRLPGAGTTLALLFTFMLAIGIALTIDGGFDLWKLALETEMALR